MLIVLIAEKKDSVLCIWFNYSQVVYYSVNTTKTRNGLNVFPKYCQLNLTKQSFK